MINDILTAQTEYKLNLSSIEVHKRMIYDWIRASELQIC